MSYKYSKGEQVIGDLKAADDAQRDTKIDFEEDYIALHTSGSAILVVSGSKVAIGPNTSNFPSHRLDVNGDIRIRNNNIRDNSGNPAVSFDGSANTTINGTLTVNDYTFPASDGNADQVLQTNGSGQLSFVDVDGGGGGSSTPQVLKVGYVGSEIFLTGGAGILNLQTVPFNTVLFDTFQSGAGYRVGSSDFIAKEAGYYDIQTTIAVDEIEDVVTQYQLYIASSGSTHSLGVSATLPFVAITQYNPSHPGTSGTVNLRMFHASTVEYFAVNQSASIIIRQIGGTGNEAKVLSGKNKTFMCVKKL